LVYARALSAAEQQTVSGYLNAKYGLGVPPIPDIRISPLTINYEASANLAQTQPAHSSLHEIRLKNRTFTPTEGEPIAVRAALDTAGLHLGAFDTVTTDLLTASARVTPLLGAT
jgi:hypothetical protein